MVAPPIWSREELEVARKRSIELFRTQRMEEPLEEYLEAFDEYQGVVEELIESTVDLTQLDDRALDILTNKNLLEAFRYLAGPPVSADDLKTLAEAVFSPKRLRKDPAMARRIVDVVRTGLDRRRFAWISEQREPTEAEREAAVLASAALMATRKVHTSRRHSLKKGQEERVEAVLDKDAKLKQVKPRKHITNLYHAPSAGEFCRETKLGTAKADFIIRLWDDRVLALECKVSNSAVNSVKRLNREAASKAEAWTKDFGTQQIVPAAVLSGVYDLHNLEDAQNRHLTLFWAHDLTALVEWIGATRGESGGADK